jgi:hypothetical protein
VHRADVRIHTRVGFRELAREWRVETDWEMKDMLSSLFARSLCLVAESTRSRLGQVIHDIHGGFT